MSRIYDELRRLQAQRARPGVDWDRDSRPFRVITLTSNKGGVGKTTVATNLAVYLRALRDDLPILLIGLDDQPTIDRMFALDPQPPQIRLKRALRSGTLAPAIRLGQYGVHYVPTSPGISELKRELDDPFALQAILLRTAWRGLVVIDTKSDFEILTQGAIAASDLALAIVKDQVSLSEARRVFALLEHWQRPRDSARVLLSLIDLRIKYTEGESRDVLSLLAGEVRRRHYPLFETFISHSPKVESLYTNPAGRAVSVLHGAPGSIVHRQFRTLAEDVLAALADTTTREAVKPPHALETGFAWAGAPGPRPARLRRYQSFHQGRGTASATRQRG